MIFATLVTRLPFLGHPAADLDEQLYSLIGSQMRHGMWPYIDLWENAAHAAFRISSRSQISTSALVNSRIIASVWAGPGVKRRRSSPRGTVG